jgi:hypothetical protein
MLLLNDVDVKSLSNEIAMIVNSNVLKSCEVDVSPLDDRRIYRNQRVYTGKDAWLGYRV